MAAPSEKEVLSFLGSLSNWGRWGASDELGTLNLVTPPKRVAAARSVTEGITVSCAWDIGTHERPDQRVAPERRMLLPGAASGPDRMTGAAEFLGLVYHGYSVTHVDALAHVFVDGRMYGGADASEVTADDGARRGAVTALADGIVTRGVLLDAAEVRGVRWLEPGQGVHPEDLVAAEDRQGVHVEEGDAVLLRTGYGRKVRERGPDAVAMVGRAGWHAACLPWLHERGVAVIGADTAQDVAPSGYETLHSPVHAVGIAAMGLWLVDNCDLEPLVEMCRELGRFDFLFVLAPLRFEGATGSPANPLAIF